MPELPDLELYLDLLRDRMVGRPLTGVRITAPFLLRTVTPAPADAIGRDVASLRRVGKRIVIDLDGGPHLVIHLMIAGRLRWGKAGGALPGKIGLAAFDQAHGALILTEAGSKKRASLHVVADDAGVRALDPGGLEVLGATADEFAEALQRENRTLKRALTDPRLLAGIGNAYSDEILHAARLSPGRRTRDLDRETIDALFEATCATLRHWRDRLRDESGGEWPKKVTAFRDGMAVHGRYREPCPDCGAPVQRIRYAENESNYCARCQTGGRLLADRGMSRLLREDWPKRLEDLERG